MRNLLAAAMIAGLIAPTAAFAATVTIEPEVQTWVMEQNTPSIEYKGDVVVGTVLPDTVQVIEIPKSTKYRYVVLNKKRVLIDAKTREVIAVY